MNKRVYISGAIAHHDISERKTTFADAERLLRRMGFEPVNPFKNCCTAARLLLIPPEL